MKWPPKKDGALLQAPTQKLTGLPEDYAGSKFTQHVCRHGATRTERLPENYPHYAREVCALCGRHLRWLPRPATIERARLNAFKLAKLAMRFDLTGWQRSFVRDISKCRKLSPRQQEILNELVAKYLEAKAP